MLLFIARTLDPISFSFRVVLKAAYTRPDRKEAIKAVRSGLEQTGHVRASFDAPSIFQYTVGQRLVNWQSLYVA
jgi:hypothetical protein